MTLTSSEFSDHQAIPTRYTCDGDDHNPSLSVSDVPVEAKSLALVVDDPDAPKGTWLHWLVWNIPPETRAIAEDSVPPGAVQGLNDFGRIEYGGPCPGTGTHRYFFRLYALDTLLALPEGASYGDLEVNLRGHIIAEAELVGTYRRVGH